MIRSPLFQKIKKAYKIRKKYGLNFLLNSVLCSKSDCFVKVGLQIISEKLYSKHHKFVMDYLYKTYIDVFSHYNIDIARRENCGNGKYMPIWTCWWQGEDNAPYIVEKCITQLRKMSNGHPVNVITKNNYMDYIELPDYILIKHSKGIISNAHFSDILRVCVLQKFGGIWLDATIFVHKQMEDSVFSYSVFSFKRALQSTNYKFPKECCWTVYAIGGKQNAILFNFLKDFFFTYWKEETFTVDYFLMDYAIAIAYRYLGGIRNELKKIPINNPNALKLEMAFNEPFDKIRLQKILGETYYSKLTYKKEYLKTTKTGRRTFYGTFSEESVQMEF